MTVYRQGDGWYMRFQVRGKRIHGPTGARTKAGALLAEGRRRSEIVDGDDPRLSKAPRLVEFAPKFLAWVDRRFDAGTLDHDTKRSYHNGLRLLNATRLPGMRLDQITADVTDTLIFPGSPSNANQALRTLRCILSYAHKLRHIGRPPRIPLREEYGRLIVIDPWMEEMLLEFACPTLHDALVIEVESGMRPEEICRMRWEHVRWNESSNLVPHGKSLRARRFVGMPDRMRAVLEARRENGSEWVFPCLITKSGRSVAKSGHVSPTSVGGKMWRTAIEKVAAACVERGLPQPPPGLVFYCGRHTYATRYLDNGGQLHKLKVLLGHASITTTEKYAHPSTEDAAEVINKHNRRGLRLVKEA
jgi:integrase